MFKNEKKLVEEACDSIPGFADLINRFKRKVILAGCVQRTFECYCNYLSKISLHFSRLPTLLTIEEIEDYLFHLKNKGTGYSENYFKFTIIALRSVFRMEGTELLSVRLPKIKTPQKLPVVLSKAEMVSMLNIPSLSKHRLLIAILYGCGLRCSEVRNLALTDIDLDRKMLHVKMGKCRKDRYVPLGRYLTETIKLYIRMYRPKKWLFGGMATKDCDAAFHKSFSQRGVLYAVQRAAEKAGIQKQVNVHTLRHSFATHLLEDGLDIISIKELLGHSNVETTMVYLHISQPQLKQKSSPIDNLEGVKIFYGVQSQIDFRE